MPRVSSGTRKELDRQIEDYKRRSDVGERISRSDAIWLLNELIYERDQQREVSRKLSDLGKATGASPWT